MYKQFFRLRTTLLVLLTMLCSVGLHAATWTWTAKSGDLDGVTTSSGAKDVALNNKTWTVTRTLKSGDTNTGYQDNPGCIQLGKNGGVENITFRSSAFEGTITKVSVVCASYNNAHKISITVGETTYLASTDTPKWASNKCGTKEGSGSSSGEIVIDFTDGSRALYIQSITVEYDDGGQGSGIPDNWKSVTYKVDSKTSVTTSGTAPDGVTASYSQTYNTAKQATSGNSFTLTLSNWGSTKLTGVKLNMKTNSGSGAGSITVKVGDTEFLSTTYAELWGANSSTYSEREYINDKFSATGDLVVKIEATANSLYCDSYTFYYEAEAISEVAAPTFQINGETVTEDQTHDAPYTYTVSIVGAEGTKSLKYTLNNGEEQTYSTPIEISTTTLLTAWGVDNSGVKTEKTSYTFTVVKQDPVFGFFKNNAYPATGSTTLLNETWERPVFKNESDVAGITFSSDNKEVMLVSDEGVLSFPETRKAGKAVITAAFAGDNNYNALTKTYTFTMNKETATISFPDESYTADLWKGANSFTAPVATLVGDFTPTYSSSKTDVATVDAESGKVTLKAAGTTIITASFAGDDIYTAANASYTLNVTAEGMAEGGSVSFDFTSEDNIKAYGFTNVNSSGATNIGNKTITQEPVTLSFTDGGTATRFYNASEIRIYKSAGSMTVAVPTGYSLTKVYLTGKDLNNLSANNGTYTQTEGTNTKYDWTGDAQSVKLTASNTANIKTLTITYKANVETLSDINLQLEGLSVEEEDVYATTYYNAAKAYEMPKGLKGYIISAADATEGTLTATLSYEPGDVVPAGEALMIVGTVDGAHLAKVTTTDADVIATNLLKGSPGAGETIVGDANNYYYYKLSKKDGHPGFYWGEATGGLFPMSKATTAYLEVEKSAASVRGFSLNFSQTPTGIDAPEASREVDTHAYDLQGRRVQQPAKGLYIVGGQKKFIK